MSFFNECPYLLRNSNRDMLFINSNSNLYCNYFSNNGDFSSNILSNNPITFSNYYFDIDEDDNIYGVFNDKSLNIVSFDYNLKKFNKINTICYDYKNYSLDFPYIKFIGEDIHVIYYLTCNTSATTILFHHYRHNGKWFENKIDIINISLLDNFTVFFNNDTPIIFYLGSVDGVTQVLTSTFNNSTCMWSSPIALTSSISNKVFLSVINDPLNFYHIAFSESQDYGYSISYINGYLNTDKFNVNYTNYITQPSDCMFPSLIKFKDTLYLMWVENKRLYTSQSSDLGLSWSEFLEDEYTLTNKFTRCFLKSNYDSDLLFNCSSIFIDSNSISILGFHNK